jgi:hypothetical protein
MNSKLRAFLWPRIADLTTAGRASQQGLIAALFMAAITVVSSSVATWGPEALRGRVWHIADVVLWLAIAAALYNKSRSAAIVGLALFVVERGIEFSHSVRPLGIVLALFFLFFFMTAVRGTFRYHELGGQRTPSAPE